MEVGAAVGLPVHHLQKKTVAADVVQPLAAKARAVNAGAAVQRVDAQSRIVRNGGQLRRLNDGLGLEKRILGKGLARFLHLDLYAEVGLRHDLHAELAQNSAHFLQFLGVLRC